jgi:hypothetical protein
VLEELRRTGYDMNFAILVRRIQPGGMETIQSDGEACYGEIQREDEPLRLSAAEPHPSAVHDQITRESSVAATLLPPPFCVLLQPKVSQCGVLLHVTFLLLIFAELYCCLQIECLSCKPYATHGVLRISAHQHAEQEASSL